MRWCVALTALGLLGCRASEAPADDVETDVDEGVETDVEEMGSGLMCRPDQASCIASMIFEFATPGTARCEQVGEHVGPSERCFGVFMSVSALIVNDRGTQVVDSAGCSLFVRDARVVPASALVPNSEHLEAGVRVRLTDEAFEIRVQGGFGEVDLRGCEGTEAFDLVSAGYLDELTLTLDAEPSDVCHRVPYADSLGASGAFGGSGADTDDETVDVQPHWAYDGLFELRAGAVRFQVPTQAVWTPWGGPGDLRERTEDGLMWQVLDHCSPGYAVPNP